MTSEPAPVLRPFAPAWWLPGPHLQTVWGRLSNGSLRRRGPASPLVALRREVIPTPDGDELVLDHCDPAPGAGSRPRVVVLHGLEGSSLSVYVQGLLVRLSSLGHPATVLNFRSCARDLDDPARILLNHRPRLYHSGETTDLDHLVRTLAAREPGRPLGAFGASLGGNVLLKWLGENPSQPWVRAAVTVSVPYDLEAGARHLETLLGRLYVRMFLSTLGWKTAETVRRFPEAASRVDLGRARRATTFFQFDDAATAPLHGFSGARDYYARSSSLGFVARVGVPTLCLSAADDPFLPPSALRGVRAAASSAVTLHVTPSGGHVGFVAGPSPWHAHAWAEEESARWLAAHLDARDG